MHTSRKQKLNVKGVSPGSQSKSLTRFQRCIMKYFKFKGRQKEQKWMWILLLVETEVAASLAHHVTNQVSGIQRLGKRLRKWSRRFRRKNSTSLAGWVNLIVIFMRKSQSIFSLESGRWARQIEDKKMFPTQIFCVFNKFPFMVFCCFCGN